MGDCIFCKIAEKQIKADIVYEDEQVLAFKDINAQAPVHVLVIPKEHIPTLNDIKDFSITSRLMAVITKLAKEYKIAQEGYRVVANCNAAAGQAVFHIHFHLLGGRNMQWPPG
ncbi:MAG: histidine triad nucleotide-binding protein [Spirochaetes bacterium]|nr:histidine triad nucleotide-binding protein [Spirochaetota bacterium]